MLFKTRSASVFGIEAHLVDVEVNLTAGTNGEFHIVGLPDVAVRESRSRVIAAIRNNGFSFPYQNITVNLAPADIKKEGSAFDLPLGRPHGRSLSFDRAFLDCFIIRLETMELSVGAQLGAYTVTSLIGKGGMGEVYCARDSKLGRDVAIKVLPAGFARDPDRMARFEREARVLASLNHPNIAAIYGVESGALVMELAEGPTLAELIDRGALPVEEALPIALQIAEAFEYAHEKGVVHRDLKPANIKVAPDGPSTSKVKVLDFGLAKAFTNQGASAEDPSNSPTLSMAATESGVILGTAAYMSPEQARGKTADRRADVWAFGVVLYEMCAGRRLFTGGTVSDVLAAVLTKDPDLAAAPGEVRAVLERCLRKDPRRRWQSMGDVRLALEEGGSAAKVASPAQVAPRPDPSGLSRLQC